MSLYRLIAWLLDYPQDNSADVMAAFRQLLNQQVLPAAQYAALQGFIDQYAQTPLLELQARYEGLFDRGRAVSLHLFEHVHGESRDRGQAMVDLQAQYRAAGLDIGVRELPDYLPLYLEFLSTQGAANAQFGLQEIAPILALLHCRLEERASPYAFLLDALLHLSGADLDLDGLRSQLAGEARDDTPEALDKVWEEEMVRFTAGDDCPSNSHKPAAGQRRDHVEFVSLLNAGHAAGASA